MANEVLDPIPKTTSRLSIETRPASEDDSAMESFTEKDKVDVIVLNNCTLF